MADTIGKRTVPDKWASASFRIIGATLNLEEINDSLGVIATNSHVKGHRSRSNVVYRESLWSLRSPLGREESLDKHLGWLLDSLESKVREIRALSQRFRVDFFCGFGSVNGQGGFVLDGVTLARLAKFGVPLGLDLYPPLPIEENEDPGTLRIN